MNLVETAAATRFSGQPRQTLTVHRTPVTCTPAAVDLAKVGLTAAGIGYYVCIAFHHGGKHAKDNHVQETLPGEDTLTSGQLIRHRLTLRRVVQP